MARNIGNIPTVEPFIIDSDTTNLARKWTDWLEDFNLYIAATGVSHENQKIALLLHLGGKHIKTIWRTLSSTERHENYEEICEKLNSYFKPKKNITYERFKFKSCKQNKEETCIEFITRLRIAAETCEFHNTSEEIRDQFVTTCYSKSLKEKLLKEDKLTLEKCKEMGQIAEQSKQQAAEMSENHDEVVNRIKDSTERISRSRTEEATQKESRRNYKSCYKCGGIFENKHLNVCPAIGRTCYNCGKANHLSKVCRSAKKVQNIQEENEITSEIVKEDCLSLNIVNKVSTGSRANKVQVKLNDVPIQMIIDTGSSIDVIDKNTFNRINKHNKICLKRSSLKVFSYGSDKPLCMMGMFETTIESSKRIAPCTVHVINKENAGNLIGLNTVNTLFNIKITNQIANISDKTKKKECEWFQKRKFN